MQRHLNSTREAPNNEWIFLGSKYNRMVSTPYHFAASNKRDQIRLKIYLNLHTP